MSSIGAVGDCQLAITPSLELQCALLSTRQILAIWPLDCLKSFSYGGGLFSFQAGRHAPRGPGEYAFITTQDFLIHSRIEKLIEKARRNSTSSGSSSRVSLDGRPPALLPIDQKSSSSDNSDIDMEHHFLYASSKTKDNMYTATDLPTDDTAGEYRPPLPEHPPPKILPKNVSPTKGWLHERFGESKPDEPPKPARPPKPEELEDHLYSHTQHIMPTNQFIQQPVADPTVYNSLHHQGPAKGQYELAYPQGHSKATSVTYETAYKKEEEEAIPPPRPLQAKVEGMTVNPLYGSQSDLLDGLGSPPPTDVTHPDVTANPVYGTSNIGKPESLPTPFKSMSTILDERGYTKINKDTSTATIPSSADSDGPPPIPARQYSVSEETDPSLLQVQQILNSNT